MMRALQRFTRWLAPAGLLLSAALAPSAASATTLSMGTSHGCSVADSGTTTCWGALPATPLAYGLRADDVRVGEDFSCALTHISVQCWGGNAFSQLGIPLLQAPWGYTLKGLRQIDQIALGARHGCARTAEQEVFCWGDGSQGQIGRAVSTTTAEAVRVEGMATITQLAAGRASTCGVRRDDHQVVCVGTGSGLAGAAEDPRTPRTVPGIRDAVEVSLFDGHACVLRNGGKLSCWGSNQHGELGLPASSGPQTTPVEVTHLGAAAQAVAVGSGFTCALLVNGTVQCWGNNANGQLGKALGGAATGLVTGIADATSISAGKTAACAALQGGSVQCWGEGAGWSQAICRVPGGLYPEHPASWGPAAEPAICHPQGSAAPMAVQGLGVADDAAQVLDWAEKTLPATFPAPGAVAAPGPADRNTLLHYRQYAGGHTLGVNAHGTPHLLYQGPASEGRLLDLGPLGRWLDEAREDEGQRSGLQLQASAYLNTMPTIVGWPCTRFAVGYGIRGAAGDLPEGVAATAVRVQGRLQAVEFPVSGERGRRLVLTTDTDWLSQRVRRTGEPVPPGMKEEPVLYGSAQGCPTAAWPGDLVDVTVLYTLGPRKGLLRTRAPVR